MTDDMQPGRELDAAVAERVMGLPVEKRLAQGYYDPDKDRYDRLEGWDYFFNHGGDMYRIPDFSTDTAAAFEAADAFLSKIAVPGPRGGIRRFKFKVITETFVLPENTSIFFIASIRDVYPKPTFISSRGDTYAHAICLMLLKAVEEIQR